MAIRRNDEANEMNETFEKPSKFPADRLTEPTTRRNKDHNRRFKNEEMMTEQYGDFHPCYEITRRFNTLNTLLSLSHYFLLRKQGMMAYHNTRVYDHFT